MLFKATACLAVSFKATACLAISFKATASNFLAKILNRLRVPNYLKHLVDQYCLQIQQQARPHKLGILFDAKLFIDLPWKLPASTVNDRFR